MKNRVKSGNFTVLVVDDEPALREIIEIDLKDAGFKVLTAENGLVALDIAKKHPIDAIITDLRMPEFGGDKLVVEIRRMFKGPMPSIIVISGHYGMTVEKAMGIGVCQLIAKPFGRNELLGKLYDALTPVAEKWKQGSVGFNADLKIDVEIEDLIKTEEEGRLAFGWGGFFIHTPEVVPALRNQVQFKLTVLGSQPFTIEGGGVVVWVRTSQVGELLPGVGIEFRYINKDCLESAIGLTIREGNRCYIPIGSPNVR